MRVNDIYLESIGAYLPETISSEWAVEQGLWDAKSYANSGGLIGVAASADISGPDMARLAALELLERSTVDTAEIDALFHCSGFDQGLDGWTPQNYLQAELIGLNVPSFAVCNACNAMFPGLELASCYLHAEAARKTVLVTVGDNLGSPRIDRWHSSPMQLIGDSGGAALLTKREGFARLRAVAGVQVQELEGMHRGDVPIFPPSTSTGQPMDIAARVGEFEARVDFRNLIKLSQQGMERLVEQLCAESDLELADISRVSFMSSNRRYLEKRLLEPFGFAVEQTTWELTRAIGHVGCAEHLVGLDYLLSGKELNPGDNVLMIGMAAGQSICGAVVGILDKPGWIN